MLDIYKFVGIKKGIKLLILSAVHGNETAGTNACRRLIDKLNNNEIKLKEGELTIVPVCNPEANKKDVRCIDENLNRVIKEWDKPTTYEQMLANEICPLIKNNRIVLDLHSTHCEGDVPFAFCDYPDEYNLKLIDVLPVDYVLEGWPDIYDAQGEIEDYSTERRAHLYGNTATTLECGYHKASESVELAYKAIMNTLSVWGMIDGGDMKKYEKKHIKMKNYVIKTREGELCKNYKHLDPVVKGEEIARYNDGEVLISPENGYILLPNMSPELGTEWYYFGTEIR